MPSSKSCHGGLVARHVLGCDGPALGDAVAETCRPSTRAIVYPGTVLYEGTMLSEGRGTTRPFELIGAPWLDGDQLALRMNKVGLEGVHFRGVTFEPTFQKHARTTCGGCQIHVTSRAEFLPVKAGVSLLRECFRSAPDRFQWRDPP